MAGLCSSPMLPDNHAGAAGTLLCRILLPRRDAPRRDDPFVPVSDFSLFLSPLALNQALSTICPEFPGINQASMRLPAASLAVWYPVLSSQRRLPPRFHGCFAVATGEPPSERNSPLQPRSSFDLTGHRGG
ncbi:hypothetical protein HPP92_029050 [Vanilla planifolia]|uniref:Uncharacterized protein n=1 Tax=Vanilla planifolia TaxID=51239 RepID=A0A835U1I8_VANPL|nr:hypothetical protein HPP92_029050 [Vanilla planifolia]KAG0446013.1 hypothetical protein HPP92_029039 [Vanilla planifolia]